MSSRETSDQSRSASPSSYTRVTTPDSSTDLGDAFKEPNRVDDIAKNWEYHASLPKVPSSNNGKELGPLAIDSGTPDAWVPRDERMVRLTGKHPYNVEAPLTDLWKAGFLTPQSLFYVRSHGATPRVSSEEAKQWTVKIHGLVEKEEVFTIADLKEKFETVTLPVTLVCAGNRRKEQNLVAKGLGFNWGAAGVSTGLFTGVYLADVLNYCKPTNPRGAFPYHDETPGCARHIIFEGCDELPKGKYGTSQRLQWARDRNKGMLLAWGLNGEALSPDHGFPLRLVVPGQIGGRMVKWLNRIEVSHKESQHHLHFWDNKLLPTQVTADQARKEEHWWYDPKYIINDLNVNAAVTVPCHDTTIDISSHEKMTSIAGYAYTGGGKRVHRVEISLDDGKTWNLAELEWPEDLYRAVSIKNHPFYGTLDLTETEMSFSWCFWKIEISKEVIGNSHSISVRATDEGLASMPRDMYWNAMSMMNNWWFRVAIVTERGNIRRFEHPTLAGNVSGGWMQRLDKEGRSVREPKFGTKETPDPNVKQVVKEDVSTLMRHEEKADEVISAEALKAHSNEQNPWFVVDGHVYDGTSFLDRHPGGAESITLVAGEDATEDFMAIHSIDAKKQMRDFHLGRLEMTTSPGESLDLSTNGCFLHPKQWKKSKIVSKRMISHDSCVFRFELDRDDQELGLPIGQHVYMRVKMTNTSGEVETVQRAYTPFSGNTQKGSIDILIKLYLPCEAFPEGGKMSCKLHQLRVGEDFVEFKGPLGHFSYEEGGIVKIHKRYRRINNVAMIAGGSGITPIWSTLKGLIEDPLATNVNIWIIDANRTEADILARYELDEILQKKSSHVRLWHILSSPEVDSSWNMGKGRISIDCLREHLPPAPERINDKDGYPIEDSLALLCGPPAMEKTVLNGLEKLGWDMKRNIVRF